MDTEPGGLSVRLTWLVCLPFLELKKTFRINVQCVNCSLVSNPILDPFVTSSWMPWSWSQAPPSRSTSPG